MIIPGRRDRSMSQASSFVWIISSCVIIVNGYCFLQKLFIVMNQFVKIIHPPPSNYALLEIIVSSAYFIS